METHLKFRRALFWDINEKDIERVLVESDDWVVTRVFEYGTLNDIFDVIDLYGKKKVKAILTKSDLRPMARAMAFLSLGVDTHKRYVA